MTTRINVMFLLVAALLAATLSGCPIGSPDLDILSGPCDNAGDTRDCGNECSSGVQLCSNERNPDGTRRSNLVWSECEGIVDCVAMDGGTPTGDAGPGMDAGPGADSGPDIDSGPPDIDSGLPSTCTCETRFCFTACDMLGQNPCAGAVPDTSTCNPYFDVPGDACTEATIPLGTDAECIAGGCVPVDCDTACGGTADGLMLCSGGVLDGFCTPFAPCGGSGTDAGMPPVDAGVDAGPPVMTDAGTDAGMSSLCPDGPVRGCTNACSIPGLAGVQVCDPAVGYGACVPIGMSCASEPPDVLDCPCVGVECSVVLACLTPCRRIGWQTLFDYCEDDGCRELRPETCVLPDAGPSDAGTDSGPPLMTDAGTDSGPPIMTDAGSDAGPGMVDAGAGAMDAGTDSGPPPVDAGTDSGPPPVDAGRDAGPPDSGPPDAGPPPVDAGSDAGPPPGDSGVVGGMAGFVTIQITGSASYWCPDSGTPDIRGFDSYGAPYSSGMTDIVRVALSRFVTGDVINNTVFCQTDSAPLSWAGYISPRVQTPPLNSAVSSDFPAIFLGTRDIRAGTYYCWDTSHPRTPDYRRFQFQVISPGSPLPLGCYATTGI